MSEKTNEFVRLMQKADAVALINLLLLLKEKIEPTPPNNNGARTLTFTKEEIRRIQVLYR